MNINIDKTRKKYTIPSGANYQFRPLNAIFISPGNTIRHEIIKCLVCYLIRKYNDFKITDKIIDLVKDLEKEIKLVHKDFIKNKGYFITEAVPKKDKNRRVDIVDLDSDKWIEIENDPKIKKGDINIYLR